MSEAEAVGVRQEVDYARELPRIRRSVDKYFKPWERKINLGFVNKEGQEGTSQLIQMDVIKLVASVLTTAGVKENEGDDAFKKKLPCDGVGVTEAKYSTRRGVEVRLVDEELPERLVVMFKSGRCRSKTGRKEIVKAVLEGTERYLVY
jgi:hypothetical protein